MQSYSRTISPEEARQLGVYDRHVFKEVPITYRGSGFYVIEFQTGIKIGISKNICNRIKEYKHPWMQSIKNIRCYSHSNPFSLERFVKKRFINSTRRVENSTEYLVGYTFDYVIGYLEQNRFFKSKSKDTK